MLIDALSSALDKLDSAYIAINTYPPDDDEEDIHQAALDAISDAIDFIESHYCELLAENT